MVIAQTKGRPDPGPVAPPRRRAARGGGAGGRGFGRPVTIGLVNNMPDTALTATERQFSGLIAEAAAGRPVRLLLFSFASVARSEPARARMAGQYRDAAELAGTPVDALIVTGTEPRAPRLDQEPYWPDMARLVDHAARHTVSTLWSCLAAHAAVLHLDRVERRPLAEKCFGVFGSAAVSADPLVTRPGAPPLAVAHSRWNGLDAADLTGCGYRILSTVGEAGVDVFAKRVGSEFVFFHGHPEYDAGALAGEYRRDIGRFLTGERDRYPNLPEGYFDANTNAVLADYRARAEHDRGAVAFADLPRLVPRSGLAEATRATAGFLFRNWLDGVFTAVRGDAGRGETVHDGTAAVAR